MNCTGFRFSRHAIERMFGRSIAPETVVRIVKDGEAILSYPDDKPFPSTLLLGRDDRGWPVHVLVARDAASGLCHVVTAYRPDPDLWGPDFRIRRQP